MQGYPAWRITGLTYNGHKFEKDIYLPVGDGEDFQTAIELWVRNMSPLGDTLENGNEPVITWQDEVYVGTWTEASEHPNATYAS